MNTDTKTINRKKNNNLLPVTIKFAKLTKTSTNIKKNVELLLLIKGELDLVLNNKRYRLFENDIVLINSGDVYQIEGENLVLSLKIDYDFFRKTVKREPSIYICNSSIDENDSYEDIRRLMSRIMYENSNKDEFYEFRIMALFYELLFFLNKNFLITASQDILTKDNRNSKYNQRLNSIITYIKQNYFDPISLMDVADSQSLTPEYLSKFFKNHMGMTFSRYLQEFRLSQAVKDLIRTDSSVITVAMNNGFPNLPAFNKIFRDVYNTTPADYRNSIVKKKSLVKEVKRPELKVTKAEYNQAFEQLNKFVDIVDSAEQYKKTPLTRNIVVSTDNSRKKTVSHLWKNLINLGYASDGLRSDFQKHLTSLQDVVKFKYARFQGIFSDEMLINEDHKEDSANYNFNKIDKLIDFLYSIGLKPFIELGEKPKMLNLFSNKIMYFRPSTNKRRNLKESEKLLEKFIVHSVNRYGISEVNQWYFELWKEGDKEQVNWDGHFDKYWDTFEIYYNVIKKIAPEAKLGGPGFNPEMNIKLLPEFIFQLSKRKINLDFFSLSLYPYDPIEDNLIKKSELSSYNGLRILPSRYEDFIRYYLDSTKDIINRSNTSIPEIHVTEWNSTISHRHPANDTTFKSAFITKNIIENLDAAESFGYWYCSDISGELKDAKSILYGDMGLISANGIRKPGFFALEMLSKLGNTLIDKGDGYIVTSKSSYNYELITYNYNHYNYLYCINEETDLTLDKYYDIFKEQQDLNISLTLKDLKKGRYRIKKYTLNRGHGSIFDEWLNMNAVQNLKKSEIEYLKQICVPKQTIYYSENSKDLTIDALLKPHEVSLYEIIFEYE